MENSSPTTPTQDASADLASLVERIRTHHQAVCGAAHNMIREAAAAGAALAELKKQKPVPHGEWAHYLRRHCELGERQAERYMQLARLVGANPSPRTDLARLSIQAAIKKLSPPASKKTTDASSGKESNSDGSRTAKHTEALAVWLRMLPEEQQRTVDAIGMIRWLAAMPSSWLPELERRIDRQRTTAAKTATDPTIGKALRQALSLQQTAKEREHTSASVAAALNGILNKLKAFGLDLNDLDVVVRTPAPTAKRHAA